MAHALALIRMTGGIPNIPQELYLNIGYLYQGQIGNFAAYLLSGTTTKLIELNATPDVYGICLMTINGEVKWAELDDTITAAMRTRINSYLTDRGLANIPVGWNNRKVVLEIFKRFNPDFDLNKIWIKD